jgi:hypothetical protein
VIDSPLVAHKFSYSSKPILNSYMDMRMCVTQRLASHRFLPTLSAKCTQLSGFKPVASGGDGAVVQYCKLFYCFMKLPLTSTSNVRVCRILPGSIFNHCCIPRNGRNQDPPLPDRREHWLLNAFPDTFPRTSEWCSSPFWIPFGFHTVCMIATCL